MSPAVPCEPGTCARRLLPLPPHAEPGNPRTNSPRAATTSTDPLCFVTFQPSRKLFYLPVNSVSATSQGDGAAGCPAAGSRTPPAPPARPAGPPPRSPRRANAASGAPAGRSPLSAARLQAFARPPPAPRVLRGPARPERVIAPPRGCHPAPSAGPKADIPTCRIARQLAGCPSPARRPSRVARTGRHCGPAHTARAGRGGGGSAGGQGPVGTPPRPSLAPPCPVSFPRPGIPCSPSPSPPPPTAASG